MNSRGKISDKWIKTRRAFLDANPPNHEGYYICYLCFKWVQAEYITVDHIIARSRAPHLRFESSNLAVCCAACNEAKGSRHVNQQKITPTEPDELEGLW